MYNLERLRRKRIIFLLGGLELGGAERQALLFARFLQNVAFANVQIWGLLNGGSLSGLCDANNVKWRVLAFEWPSQRIGKIRSLAKLGLNLRSEHPDVLLPYTMWPNIVCGSIWRITGARLCVWNQRDEGRHRMGNHIEQWAARQTPLFLSNSTHGKDFIVRTYHISPAKVHVIPNAVELEPQKFDRKTWRLKLGIPEQTFVACMVGNLHSYKDHSTLLKSWRLVMDAFKSENRAALLVLAGHFGNTYKELCQLLQDLGINQTVRFLGSVEDISGLLATSDLGVFSSRFEGSPNGVLECMKAGLAIVATDIPGIREALSEDYPFLALPGDANVFAEKILTLYTNPDLRRTIGKINRERVSTEFNPTQICYRAAQLLCVGLKE